MNLSSIQHALETGRLVADAEITEASLEAAGLVRLAKVAGVRLLATGEISRAIRVTVSGASVSAISKVEQAGGSVTTTLAAKAATDEAPAA